MKPKSIILLFIFAFSFNSINAQIGWYLKVNGTTPANSYTLNFTVASTNFKE